MSTTTPLTRRNALLDVKGAQKALGGVSRSTVYRLIAEGSLLPVRVAGRTMFDPGHLRDFVRANQDRPARRAS